MPKLYACIISPDVKRDKNMLLFIAYQFSYAIELLEDGILFDVSGLERLIGKPEKITQKILAELKQAKTPGSVAVAETVETAMLLARQKSGEEQTLHSPDTFRQLPLQNLDIEQDTLNVFNELGIYRVEDLLAIPHDDLISRYGREFEDVIRTIRQNGRRFLTPNVKESSVAWKYDLDLAVEDFEQLIFIVNHGLDNLFAAIAHEALSTEHLDITFHLCKGPHASSGAASNTDTKTYAIKTSFPTLDKSFWLKLLNLRISLAPPEAAIRSLNIVAYFTRPRPDQKGLYAVSRPEPESLLLTVNKIKKLVGEKNVGVPILVDQRLSEAFDLDADRLPAGTERIEERTPSGIVAFSYFRPALRAEVLVREGRLVFIKTRYFSSHVTEYSGVWKANSKWWDTSWKTQEWDVEVEDHGVYRLCKVNKEWFLAGEYD